METAHMSIKDIKKPNSEELEKIDIIREKDIDYSDIPEITEEEWKYMQTHSNVGIFLDKNL